MKRWRSEDTGSSERYAESSQSHAPTAMQCLHTYSRHYGNMWILNYKNLDFLDIMTNFSDTDTPGMCAGRGKSSDKRSKLTKSSTYILDASSSLQSLHPVVRTQTSGAQG